MVYGRGWLPGAGNQQFFPELVDLWQQPGSIHTGSLLPCHHHQINGRQSVSYAAKRLTQQTLEAIAFHCSLGYLFGDRETKARIA